MVLRCLYSIIVFSWCWDSDGFWTCGGAIKSIYRAVMDRAPSGRISYHNITSLFKIGENEQIIEQVNYTATPMTFIRRVFDVAHYWFAYRPLGPLFFAMYGYEYGTHSVNDMYVCEVSMCRCPHNSNPFSWVYHLRFGFVIGYICQIKVFTL